MKNVRITTTTTITFTPLEVQQILEDYARRTYNLSGDSVDYDLYNNSALIKFETITEPEDA